MKLKNIFEAKQNKQTHGRLISQHMVGKYASVIGHRTVTSVKKQLWRKKVSAGLCNVWIYSHDPSIQCTM